MPGHGALGDVAIIGAGRLGQGLALALTRRGRQAVVFGRDWSPQALEPAALILLAVPDSAIVTVASALAARGAVRHDQVVLHLSGLADSEALAPLASTRAARGSFHPLQSIADPASAPERLEGSYAGIEGDERALAAAEALAETLGMTAVRIPAHAKPAYHAGAAIVSNYTVTLVALAQRIAATAGIPAEVAADLYLPLLRGTIANLATLGPAAALTGPVRRGDVSTVRAHLDALAPEDRALYRHLALATLKLVAQSDPDSPRLADLEQLLGDTT